MEIVNGASADNVNFAQLLAADKPVILKGLAADWPLVQAGKDSPHAAMAYLSSFDSGKPIVRFAGKREIRGRFFYNEAMTALNFA
jgi:hypothetical protein